MLKGSDVLISAVWILLAFLNLSFGFLDFDSEIIKHYNDHISDLAALVAAFFCYRAAFGFDKGHSMRIVWLLLATGMLFWGGGAIYDSLYVILNKVDEAPYPSYADIGYLGMVILFIAGCLIFKKEVGLETPLWGKFFAGFMFAVAIIFSSLTDCFTETGIAFIVSSTYAILDGLLLSIVILLATSLRGGHLAKAWWFMTVGILLYLCADNGHTYLAYKELYSGSSALNAGWVMGFGLIAIAAMITYNMFHRDSRK